MISLSGDFYVTITFQSATFQIITRRERSIRIILNHSDFHPLGHRVKRSQGVFTGVEGNKETTIYHLLPSPGKAHLFQFSSTFQGSSQSDFISVF
jgi:hypothetical protein